MLDTLHNRRHAPRYAAEWMITVRTGRTMTMGRALDVSSMGILFRVPRRLRMGENIEVDITPHVSRSLTCSAQVVREGPRVRGHNIYGARFQNLSVAEREVLRKTLQMFGKGWVRGSSPLGDGLLALRNHVTL